MLPFGQASTVWFGLLAVCGIVVLLWIARWFTHHMQMTQAAGIRQPAGPALPRKRLVVSFAILGALLLSKFIYIETFKNYYAFFLIEKFGLDVPQAGAFCSSSSRRSRLAPSLVVRLEIASAARR